MNKVIRFAVHFSRNPYIMTKYFILFFLLFSFQDCYSQLETEIICKEFTLIDRYKDSIQFFDKFIFNDETKDYFVYVDSNQYQTEFQNKSLKTLDIVIGQKYFLCLTGVYFIDADRERSLSIRGIINIKERGHSGGVYMTNDIQFNRIIRRKKNSTKEYCKRSPNRLQ